MRLHSARPTLINKGNYMPRRGSEANLLTQGLVDVRPLAMIIEHYKNRGQTEKLYNMSTLLRAIVNDWADKCGGEYISQIEIAVDILEREKLIPHRIATQKRLLNAEIDQARIAQRAEGYPVTKMEPKKETLSQFDIIAQRAYNKFKLDQQKEGGITETFTEKMKRLAQEREQNKLTFSEQPADMEKLNNGE